jgi:hypothetical protein
MRRILVGGLAIIGGLAMLVVVVGLGVGVVYWTSKGRIPAKTILEVDFERGLTEYVPDDPVAQVMLAKTPIVRNVVEALKRASEDDRVVALVARVGMAKMGLRRSRRCATPSSASAARGNPPSLTPKPSARPGRETARTTSPPPSTRSTCSLRAT